MAKPVLVREVWASNMHQEFQSIYTAIRFGFCFASFDTEFPGIIHDPLPKKAYSRLPPQAYYSIMKRNVDELRIIQLGLTLFDASGNLPRFNTPFGYVWQFNFSDFDPKIHPHNRDSISLLEKQGIDFSENERNGINSHDFACRFQEQVLCFNMIWITFQGSYDFALLTKILTRELPNDVEEFTRLVRSKFGVAGTFDVKLIARILGYHGGLEKVGKSLGLARVAGKSHQAGSDSLLTMQVYKELCNKWYYSRECFIGLNHKLYGLAGVEDATMYQRLLYCSSKL